MGDAANEGKAPTGPVSNAWRLEIPKWTKEEIGNKTILVEESSFATLFPKYREDYIKQYWPLIQKAFEEYNITAELDLVEGSMMVKTTRKTWDPAIILKARDIIKLLSRSVPYEQAVRVLQDDIFADIVKIGSMVRKKETFIKRRQRLIGPNGCTLKSIELLTECYVLVQGQTVAALGPYKGLQAVRKIAEDTMNNIHPIYHIKVLMIKRELAKDPQLKNENWERFLPKFKTSNVSKRKQPKNKKIKKQYTPFPPPQLERKVDKQLASGEYFLKEDQKVARRCKEMTDRQTVAAEKRGEKRLLPFVPPEETLSKSGGRALSSLPSSSKSSDVDVEALKKKILKAKKQKKNK